MEVGALAPAQASITRVEAEVSTPLQATTSGRVYESRICMEVLGRNPGSAQITRLDVEVSTPSRDATLGDVSVSRISMEVGAKVVKKGGVTRLDVEVATPLQTPTSGAIAITRISAEVAAHKDTAGPVTPLALAAGIEVFLHNWVDGATLRSSYSTDISTAPATGAESRRGLLLKPERTMSLQWDIHADDDGQRARLDRLLVMLRKLTNERIAVPLYMDQREIHASYLTTDDTIFFDTSIGRFFTGARVVIVQLDSQGLYESHTFHIIDEVQDDRLIFTTTLGVAVPAGSLCMPMIDCEVMLEASAKYVTARNASVQMDVIEVPGASQLPPVKSDFPTDAQTFQDAPIFDFDPDWLDGIEKGRSRQGQRYSVGRGSRTYAAGERSREVHKLTLTGLRGSCADEARADIWRVVEFWDTRRGRLRSFWLVDQEQVWEMESIDPTGNFLGIHEFGDFTDFSAELEGGWIGLEMDDGTVYVREAATVQHVLTVYRVTMSPPLPTNLDFTSVVRVARGRRTRFDSDELVEKWTHAGYLSVQLDCMETVNERNAST